MKFARLNKLDLWRKEVYKLVKLITTIPSTIASAEKRFKLEKE